MNDTIWDLLQIEPTTDQAQIKRAYARQSRVFHPEEDPEGFLRLREAYSRALKWAEIHENKEILPNTDIEKRKEEKTPQEIKQKEKPQSPPNRLHAPLKTQTPKREETSQDQDEEELRNRKPDQDKENYVPQFVFRRDSDVPNPYRESEAYHSFLAVYKKENQKNWKLWMEYITSPEFLAVGWEEEFCALIEETVREKEPEVRPGQEFIKSLYIAYCFTATDTGGHDGEVQRRFRQEQGSLFVPEPILAMAGRYPIPRRMTGSDYTMKSAFINYFHLKSIEEGIGWTDQGLHGLRIVLELYKPAYIKDNYTGNKMTDFARHPLSLRLLNYFFDTAGLSTECYRMAWDTLGLKQAVMGRNRLLYGRLREICMEKYPELNEEEPKSFYELNSECVAYFERCLARKLEEPQQDELEAQAFFRREDLKLALRNRRYVETNVLNHWISYKRGPAFLCHLRAFYEADPALPCARQVLQYIESAEESLRIFERNTEDEKAPASDEAASMNYRPFLRYWLNTAFRDFRELKMYLQDQLPYSPEWARRLLGKEEGQDEISVSRRIVLQEMEIEVWMHLYYVEYRLGGQEVFRPFIPYEKVKALETEEFLLLLPMTIPDSGGAKLDFYEPDARKLSMRLKERLAQTALPPEDQEKIAECLSGELLQRLSDRKKSQAKNGEAAFPLRIYRETAETLYCAEWWQDDRRICLYIEQGQNGMQRHSSEVYDFIGNETQAIALGKELLDCITS